jgi:hypothetical protein
LGGAFREVGVGVCQCIRETGEHEGVLGVVGGGLGGVQPVAVRSVALTILMCGLNFGGLSLMDWPLVKLRGERTHEDGIDRIHPAKEMAAIGSRNPSGQDALTLKYQSAKVDHTPSRVRLPYPDGRIMSLPVSKKLASLLFSEKANQLAHARIGARGRRWTNGLLVLSAVLGYVAGFSGLVNLVGKTWVSLIALAARHFNHRRDSSFDNIEI